MNISRQSIKEKLIVGQTKQIGCVRPTKTVYPENIV